MFTAGILKKKSRERSSGVFIYTLLKYGHMIKNLKGIVATIALFGCGGLLYGQGQSPPPPQGSGPPPPPGFPVPIDHDIWILLVMGLGLGLYLVYSRKTKPDAA